MIDPSGKTGFNFKKSNPSGRSVSILETRTGARTHNMKHHFLRQSAENNSIIEIMKIMNNFYFIYLYIVFERVTLLAVLAILPSDPLN